MSPIVKNDTESDSIAAITRSTVDWRLKNAATFSEPASILSLSLACFHSRNRLAAKNMTEVKTIGSRVMTRE